MLSVGFRVVVVLVVVVVGRNFVGIDGIFSILLVVVGSYVTRDFLVGFVAAVPFFGAAVANFVGAIAVVSVERAVVLVNVGFFVLIVVIVVVVGVFLVVLVVVGVVAVVVVIVVAGVVRGIFGDGYLKVVVIAIVVDVVAIVSDHGFLVDLGTLSSFFLGNGFVGFVGFVGFDGFVEFVGSVKLGNNLI